MRRSSKHCAGQDITATLAGWNFQPGQINVRIIRGQDGTPKIQVRLDLGLLQMELNDRPDGKRPHNSPTELHHQMRRLDRHRKACGTVDGFTLSPAACAALRAESAMFYHRYLSMFVLEIFDGVIRDTLHNLMVLDFCRRFAAEEHDRSILEQYRPYLVMMQGRARACQALQAGFPKTALAYLKGTLKNVLELYPRPLGRRSSEARVLKTMIHQVRDTLPTDPLADLRRQIHQAVKAEHYEQAAQLRDQLLALETVGAPRPAKARRAKVSVRGQARAASAAVRRGSSRRRNAPTESQHFQPPALRPPQDPPSASAAG